MLIAATATFAAWLAGIITTLKGNASDFQANSAKFTNSLSMVYLKIFISLGFRDNVCCFKDIIHGLDRK
jgi:hypothetical protein